MRSPEFLSDVLKRDGNNFDVLRLLAAIAVIVGHSYAIAPQPPHQDLVLGLLHFDYSGSLAVKFFFFLSGLLVTNSIIGKPNAFHFMIKRAFRIFPGLLLCLVIAVFFVGPVFTTMPLTEYFSAPETWRYLFRNFTLGDIVWRLPGVFDSSKLGLNGSLWTLPNEVLCYLFIAIFYGLGLLRYRMWANIFFVAVIISSFIFPAYLPSLFAQNPEAQLLPGCFAMGALLANNKNLVQINITGVVLLWLLVIVLSQAAAHQFVFYAAFFYSTLFVASREIVKTKMRLPFDASYGIYLYGFMVQQCVYAILPGAGVYGNQLISILISCGIGIFSWFLVEKRSIVLGNKITGNVFGTSLKERGSLLLKSGLPGSRLPQSNFFIFVCFALAAFIVHAIVLRFIFPGYYSPLYPQHSDFYIPAAFANGPDTFRSLLSWPRPVNMIFSKLIGYFGIHGSIACVIAIVCFNCALGALLIKRLFNVSFNWQLLTAYLVYCYLLFSQPYFYTFYAQDIGAQLSYFFLILGAYGLYATLNRPALAGNLLLFCCALLAFLSKETYGLAALVFAFLWFIYYKRNDAVKAILPFFMVVIALGIAFVINIFIKSTFINLDASAGAAYQISRSPTRILQEFFKYVYEGMNIANLIVVLLLFYILLKKPPADLQKALWFIVGGCIAATGFSLLPNALLPNHHYKGYSFNGAYLFYLPVLLLPFFYMKKMVSKGVFFTVAVLCLISPLLNINKYKDNTWVIIQESTQRNLLTALKPLISGISPTEKPQKILIQGITFPFHPFAFPQALRVFPNARFALFDVVNYNPSFPNNQRKDLVEFVSSADTNATVYDKKWVFDQDGNLVTSLNLAADRIFNRSENYDKAVVINQHDFADYTTAGFYNPENGIRWTNGNAVIQLVAMIEKKDSIVLTLRTYMPPVCRDITPKILLVDSEDKVHAPAFSSRKDNEFKYLFTGNIDRKIKKINIVSEKINAFPDRRELSFPFVSLDIVTKAL